MQNLGGGGQIRCIMGDVQVTNPAILTEQAWSIKCLFYCQIIVVLIHNGLSCSSMLFSILRVGKPPRQWFISFSRLPFPSSFASTLNVPMVFLTGSFSIDDGNCSEKDSFKMNSRFFNLFRVYSNLLKMASVGEFPRSWFLEDRTQV